MQKGLVNRAPTTRRAPTTKNALRFDQSLRNSFAQRFGAPGDIELLVDICQMKIDRPLAYIQASGDFFAALPSLPDGIHVCGFSATFRDNDASHDLTATLERRSGIAGSSINNQPQIMATVKSTGANANIRIKSTQSISNSTVDAERFAYFVRVSLPAGNTIDLVKLGLDLKISC